MQVTVIPLTDFTHDSINAREGRAIPNVDKSLADEWARNNLVRLQRSAPPREPRAREFNDPGKAPAAGAAQQSSLSPAARASLQTTAHGSRRGGR